MIPKSRVESFSDGVMAIVMTLIAFELHPPSLGAHISISLALRSLVPLAPLLLSFALSFTMVTVYWVNHYYLFHHIKTATSALLWFNSLLLFWICLLPFSTQFLGDHPTHPTAIMLYALNLLLIGLSYLLMRQHAVRANLFDEDKIAVAFGPHHSIPAIALSILAIVIAPINRYIALLCLFLLPFLYVGPKTWRHLVKASNRWRARKFHRQST